MEIVYFTIVAAALYIVSDRILDLLERRAGRRFDNRSLIFFAIIMTLSLLSFASLRALLKT